MTSTLLQQAAEALTLTEEERQHIHQAIDKLGDYEYLRPELRTETGRTRGVLQKLFRFLPQRMAALQQQPEPVAEDRDLHSHMMVVATRAAEGRAGKLVLRDVCRAIAADKNLRTKLTIPPALQQQEEPREVAAENDAFNEWWESSGQGAEPLHTLTTENCARATWHERARRAASPSPQATQQAMPPEVAEQFAFFKSLAKNPAYYRNRLSKLLAWIESPSPQDFTLPMVEEGKGVDGVEDRKP